MINNIKKFVFKNRYLLIIAALFYGISFIFSTKPLTSSPEKIKTALENYLSENENLFQQFISDTVAIEQVINKNVEPERVDKYLNSEVAFFVYSTYETDKLEVAYWSTNKMFPDNIDTLKDDGHYFVQHLNGSFEFIKKQFFYKGKKVIATALIPIYWNYFLHNSYLATGFPALDNLANSYDLVAEGGDIRINSGQGKPLFGLSKKEIIQGDSPGPISLSLRLLSIMVLLVLLNSFAFDVAKRKGWKWGFFLLAVTVLSLRLISYYFTFPLSLNGLGLFDNLIYASNDLNPTLGDLLINVILSFWLVSFVKFTALHKGINLSKYKGKKALAYSIFLSILLIAFAFVCAGITRSLIKDSSIPFDVTNFFSLNIYTLVSFIILCFIILTFFHFSHIILLFIYKAVDVPVYARYLTVSLCGLFYLSLSVNISATTSNVFVLSWLLMFMLIMEFRKQDIFVPLFRSSFFLIWLIFFAASISGLVIYQNDKKSIEQGRKAGESLAWDADPTIQNLLSAGIVEIDSSFLALNFGKLTQQPTNKLIKDSLTKQYFSSNFNRYQTRLYTFDADQKALFNDDSATCFFLRNIIETRSKKTFHPDLFFYQKEAGSFSFIYEQLIKDESGKTEGYFFVVVEPQKYKGQTIYPELLRSTADVESELNVTYAIYDHGQLIKSVGDYNFLSSIPYNKLLDQEFVVDDKDDHREMWFNAGSNKYVVIIERGTFFVEFITLFAYLFGSFLFIIILFQVGHVIFVSQFRMDILRSMFRLNLRHQIQGAITFISVFSFLIIGIATIAFYISRFQQTNRERLVKAIKIMGNEIERQIYSHAQSDDVVKIYDQGANAKLKSSMQDISEVHAVDANLYDLEGNLQATTQPDIYNKELLSNMMEPRAFYKLHYRKEIQCIQDEKVSNFSFLSIYIPLNDEGGKPYAYLNIPYLNTQKELNQEISNFLVTLICLNAFIFVIAGLISVLLTNRITNSFSLIAGKMQEVNLGKAIEEIEWRANDEIGALVKEYNKMVRKLDKSARALAKSEREGAWREMARQVAHEIKNPLTPMKLSIQYLQRAIQEKNPDMQALSLKVSATLVEQIDQLAKIASDFSQFAQIGTVNVETFDINELLSSLINLYSTNQKLNIKFNQVGQKALISADRTQINRLFTNLLQNAVEASEDKEINKIIIQQEINENKLLVSIVDFGSGISSNMHSQIFKPNFTTKSSGTGLGLAMCKGIVEKANGRIWFETKEGKGTTFFVLLPLVGMP